MAQRTALYQHHVNAQAKIVDFASWDMPLHYGSQLNEHHIVRTSAGMFDVSHMVVVDVEGTQAQAFLCHLLANDISKLKLGQALYGCMLKPDGGIIDDLITYYCAEGHYRVVVNAGTCDKDLAWIHQHAPHFNVKVTQRSDLSILAVQGPEARAKVAALLPVACREAALSLKPFYALAYQDYFIGRTGYTGEDGFEIIVPHTLALTLWGQLLAQGVKPCGLGARDTLRLEAGMNLYGTDMDESISPLECGLTWTVDFKNPTRDFIGRKALEQQLAKGLQWQMVGLVMTEKGVLRGHQTVITNQGEGITTSGTFSPTLGYAIALAKIPVNVSGEVTVDIRGKAMPVQIVKPPFIRHGKKVYS